MSTQYNRHGLSRYIDADIKRQIRRDCGFGCVICGASIITYEHIDPEFNDATEHDPAHMALLCEGCHGKVTRKFWSKAKVINARRLPKCRTVGFSHGEFDFGERSPYIKFAGFTFRNCPTPLSVSGIPVFSIEAPEELDAPFRLSATFADPQGKTCLEIVRNEWKLSSGLWDAECVGGRIEIRSQEEPYTLILKAEPPHGIAVERLHMRVKHVEFIGDTSTLETRIGNSLMSFTGCFADNCQVGLAL
jgi:hypothetical protein